MPSKHITNSRSISRDIITDKRVSKLKGNDRKLAHFRIILVMDNLGRVEADPKMLHSLIFPVDAVSPARVAKMSLEMHEAGLYFLYRVNGEMYLQSPSFGRQRMVGHMKRASELPAPDLEEYTDWLVNVRQDSRFSGLPHDKCLVMAHNLLTTCSIDGDEGSEEDENSGDSEPVKDISPDQGRRLNFIEAEFERHTKASLPAPLKNNLVPYLSGCTSREIIAALVIAHQHNALTLPYVQGVLRKQKGG